MDELVFNEIDIMMMSALSNFNTQNCKQFWNCNSIWKVDAQELSGTGEPLPFALVFKKLLLLVHLLLTRAHHLDC